MKISRAGFVPSTVPAQKIWMTPFSLSVADDKLQLIVAIADPAAWIAEGSKLDKVKPSGKVPLIGTCEDRREARQVAWGCEAGG